MHVAPGLPSREEVHDLVSAIRQGKDAEATELDGVTRGYLLALPLYAVGGNVRIRWSSPYVLIVDALPVSLSVRAWDRAHGEILDEITLDPGVDSVTHPTLGQLPFRVQKLSQRYEVRASVSEMSSTGRFAAWDLMMMLEEPIAHFVHGWAKGLAAQQGLDVGGLLGPEERARVRDEIMLGTTGRSSSLTRLIDRLSGDIKDRTGDARQYLIKNLRRDALDAVRRAVGESRHGDLVRKTAEEIGSKDHDTVLQAVKAARPHLTIGLNVVKTSLSTSHTLHANSMSLEELIDRRSVPGETR